MIQTVPITPSDVTAAIGFMLTLVSLIGTYFYVHLSNWLREILELRMKYELNSVGDTEPRKQGRLECRYQLRRLFNHVTLLVSLVISFFILFVVQVARRLVAASQPEPAAVSYYKAAATVFLIIYFGLTTYMLILGYLVALSVRRKLKHHG
ncbi:MAG TPA: hypothetical protein VKM94_20405 [Blastocatellia bacterium]|nr:hypothetical protein [Blastocatellia bacterium]